MSTATKTSNRKTAPKKETAVATPAPVAAVAAPVAPAAPVAAPVAATVEATAVVVEEVNVVAEFNSLVSKFNSMRETFASVLSDMKKLEKRIPRELKKASKKRKGAKAAADGDKPKRESIFKKPVQISDDLCTFLGKPKGTLISRSDVTSAVCGYAKSKGLMNKQVIDSDAPLRKLLKITEKDPELTILNLQYFLKQHYIKAAVPTA